MKKYLLAIATILLLTQGVYSQQPQTHVLDGVYTKSDEEQITNIDKMTHEIKANLSSYKKTQKFKDSTDYSYVYKKDKELQLISIYSKDVSQNLSSVKEWYFHNGRLIFAEQITTERKSNSVIDKEKMYLDNENLFSWIQSGNKIDSNSDKFKRTAKGVREYADELRLENMK